MYCSCAREQALMQGSMLYPVGLSPTYHSFKIVLDFKIFRSLIWWGRRYQVIIVIGATAHYKEKDSVVSFYMISLPLVSF